MSDDRHAHPAPVTWQADVTPPGKPGCTGACTEEWTPLTASGDATAATGAKSSLLSSFKRNDGGTQVLYLTHVDFEKIGFRFKQDESVPHLQQTVSHGIYKGFVGPVALYGLLGAVLLRNRGKSEKES